MTALNTFEYTDHRNTAPISSFANDVYYNSNTKTLVIETDSDSLAYENVSKDTFEDFVNADSLGTYFQKHIRGVADYLPDAEYYFYKEVEKPEVESSIHVDNSYLTTYYNSPATGLGVGVGGVITSPSISVPAKTAAPTRYTIYAEFDNFEDAYTAFSYLERGAKTASFNKEDE